MKSLCLIVLSVCAALFPAAESCAQSKAPPKAKIRLPRVGTIRDYPATGLTAGCGNSYYYFEGRTGRTGEDYVFIANRDGTIAWMNLDGRDVSLKLVEKPPSDEFPFQSVYRWKKVSIVVRVADFKPPDAPYEEGDSMFRMNITLRRGRARKTIRAVGSADC